MDSAQQIQALAAAASMRQRFGDWDGVSDLCLAALRLQPDAAPFWTLLGKARAERAQPEAAISCLTRAVRLSPGSVDALVLLVQASQTLHRPHLTLSLYRVLLSLVPENAQLFHSASMMLNSMGRVTQAIVLAERALRLAPGQAAVQCSLGHMLKQVGRLGQAEAAYRAAIRLDAGGTAPQLALFHLLMEAGRAEEGIALGQAVIAADPAQTEEVLSAVGLLRAERGEWPAALATFRRLAADCPKVRGMLGDDIASGRPPAAAGRLFADGTAHASEALPPMAGRFRAAYEAGGWQGRRIAVLMPRHINCDPNYIEHDIARYVAEAAAAAGLPALVIDADEVSYPAYMTARKRQGAPARLASIRAEILAFRPDFVVVDGNAYGDGDTVNPDWLNGLKEACGCRVVAMVMDNYGPKVLVMQYWAAVVDAFVHFEPASAQVPGVADDRLLLSYVPVADFFFSGAGDRGTAGLFVGSPSGRAGGYRALWLAAIMAHVPDCRVLLTNRLARNAPSLREYAELHRAARLSFNFGGRRDGKVIITGRTYESIASGALLFEQQGSRLDAFFTPWVHYIPFRDASELVGLAHHLLADGGRAGRMAAGAQAFMRHHYAPAFFWPYVIRRLEETLTAPAAPVPPSPG